MRNRAITVAALVVLLMTAWSGARAQQPVNLGQPTNPPGWVFNIAPYLWLPTINTNLDYNLPPALGARLPTQVSVGPGDLLSNLDFAAMVTADARNGPFSLLTDILYTRVSVGASDSRIKSVDFLGLPSVPISRSVQASISTNLGVTVWTLAGGYTVLQGEWGNLDVLAGLRLLSANSTTNYSLTLTLVGPRGNGATFGGIGGVPLSRDVWNGIGGLRGRFRIQQSQFFIPYYFDIGGGGSRPTWQIASGLGYQFRWGAVSATYRYLVFNQDSSNTVQRLALRGPMLMVNFTF